MQIKADELNDKIMGVTNFAGKVETRMRRESTKIEGLIEDMAGVQLRQFKSMKGS